MNEGDVVLTPVPQADGQVKNRPALVLRTMPGYGDFLVCGISRQLHQHVERFDEIIGPGDADYGSSGLRSASLIRLGFLAVVPRKNILGSIGSISPERHTRMLRTLSTYLLQGGKRR